MAHFGKKRGLNPREGMQKKMELAKQAGGGLDAELADLIAMVRYLKKMLNEPESYERMKRDVNIRLLSVLGLFDATVDKKFLDDLMG